ncbi:DUF3320 domain-containing protein [Nonomuraea sp. NPDC049607]|uniref:DUF3320 domain-containing protein n=1 Tax=Nonomuraea sp. NPDC049607 TaxID=3154732 RepID=UPI0034271851
MTKSWHSDWPVVDPEIPAEDRKLIEDNPQLQGLQLSTATQADWKLARELQQTYHDRYVIASELDKTGRELVSRALVAANRVLTAEVTRQEQLDAAAAAVMLPQQLWEIAKLARMQTEVRRDLDNLADVAEFATQQQALDASLTELTSKVEELEAYAATVVETERLAQLAVIRHRMNDRVEDLLSHTSDSESLRYLSSDAETLKQAMQEQAPVSERYAASAFQREVSLDEGREAQLVKVLRKWRDSLIDLSGRNKLLNFKPGANGLEIIQPGTHQLIRGLDKGMPFAELPEDLEGKRQFALKDGEILTHKDSRAALTRALRKLYRDSTQIYTDTGLWALALGMGALEWSDDGGKTFMSAPLMLEPVHLERTNTGSGFRMRATEEDDTIPNPALAVKMETLGIKWPAPEAMQDLPSAISAVRESVRGIHGWRVTDRVVLAIFQSHKEAMYRDLLDNEGRVLSSPLVAAVALSGDPSPLTQGLYFDPPELKDLDVIQPPETAPLVLDADSSQRQCIAAAVNGHSFVMDGPPGTGKSQTIANMIASLLHAGRTVLFVSEKAAALDVVRNRLNHAGLDSFLLPLHSHNTSRKHVAQQLGRALMERTKAVKHSVDSDRLRGLLGDLSGYADAMNRIRQPLERSLHDVLGRLNELAGVRQLAPRRTFDPSRVTAREFQEILVAARGVAKAWRPVAEGETFLWRGLASASSPQIYLDRLGEEHHALITALDVHYELAMPLGMNDPARIGDLIDLLGATAERPVVPVHWLTSADLPGLRSALLDFAQRRDQVLDVIDRVVHDAGPRWNELDRSLTPAPSAEELALSTLSPHGIDITALTAQQAKELSSRLSATADMLVRHQLSLSDLAELYGVAVPVSADAGLRLCRLAAYSAAQAWPEAVWLTPAGRQAATAAVRELTFAINELIYARSAAADLFTDAVLYSDQLAEVASRFATLYRGLKKLSSAYRKDKAYVASLTTDGVFGKTTAERLPQAIAWRAAHKRYLAVVATHAGALGAYWNGETTDYELIRQVLTAAADIEGLAGPVQNRAALNAQVAHGGTPNAFAAEVATSVCADLERWQAELAPAPQAGGRPQLARMPLTDVVAWYRAHLGPLRSAAELAQHVDQISAAQNNTLGSARRRLGLAIDAWRSQEELAADANADREILGELFDGIRTAQSAIDGALTWAERAQDWAHGPLPEMAAHALLASAPDPVLTSAYSRYVRAADELSELFSGPRNAELLSALLSTADAAQETVTRLLADRNGAEEWRAFVNSSTILGQYGLADLIERSAAQSASAADFPSLVECAVLRAWAEHVLSRDPALAVVRGPQRDDLVDEFRRLDEAVIANAYSQVIDACNARMPKSFLGPAAIIQREAEKKSRHLPVRVLLHKAPDVVQRLKPCFMMSPLTVSQFLPPDFKFDVVIFDEASQVMPHDAINCIYRGKSLIVAGDQKQMPPTNFFGVAEAETDEYDEEIPDTFESLLDLCKASGQIRSMPLRWHYRSRHEGLIAFSNQAFYDGALVTFPAPRTSAAYPGITFHKVTGRYYRGTARNNPIEAEVVASRVLEHFRIRPGESLGVVAMSSAQAQAIEDAVERARLAQPDLDKFFTEGRLDGFFVKNLETVQGDERDAILLSVGYGPDERGKLSLNFGPLNRADGWRRLNVAITRARYRVEVISSISGSDIPDSNNTSRQYFKRYLEYAERGTDMLPGHASAGESPVFERTIAEVIRNWAYDVTEQVGIAGYRIDVAVKHPEDPGRYVLGIECDGRMYASSAVARDRDRLRDQVLRLLGWRTYRLWAADWYRDPRGAGLRLREAIEQAVVHAEEPEIAIPAAEPASVMVENATEEPVAWGEPYRRARTRLIPRTLPEMHLYDAQPQLRALLMEIASAEAPIHHGLLYQRAREAWGVGRTGSRISDNLNYVLYGLVREGQLILEEEFVYVPGNKIVARSPGDGVERKVGQIAPAERDAAIFGIIGDAPGISQADLITEVTRFFGWRRTGAEITATLNADLSRLAAAGRISGLPERIGLVNDAC